MSHSIFRRLNHKHGTPVDPISRRKFLAASAAVGMATMLSCAGPSKPRVSGGKRVVVIGAGFSGLMAAHELRACGYDVFVIDARKRLGGRVVTYRDLVPGRHVEGGAELIGSNHPTWVACKERFKLDFMDVGGPDDLPLFLGNTWIDEAATKKLYEELAPAYAAITADAAQVPEDAPWTAPNARTLDLITIADWLNDLKSRGLSPLAASVLKASFEGDNGVPADKQSYLGMLTAIKGGGLDKYWSESEVFRCKQGNQALAECLAKGIGADRIKLDLPVVSVKDRGDKMLVASADKRVIECDDVILTVAPSAWPLIQFNGLIPRELDPQMGTNVKYIVPLAAEPWKDSGHSPDAITDAQISESWEACDGQAPGTAKPGEPVTAFTAFSGGPAADLARSSSGPALHKAYAKTLEAMFPGFTKSAGTPRFMDWPSDQWTRAGYSFPGPGQVTTHGPLMAKPSGGLHFAGEHTCYKFVGYMEGALSSGVAVAERLAKRDGRAT